MKLNKNAKCGLKYEHFNMGWATYNPQAGSVPLSENVWLANTFKILIESGPPKSIIHELHQIYKEICKLW